ncbi:putative ribonuclease P complex subunit Pop1 [Patellaria atrata CBS 101060]|uniref:Ribonuclease P complex subunit Pop1 n=1 Tax=Patellaria atrata CBS 101060 TaxID=1346257 RepID=A0A9P4VNN9_9PEZI|nr:putative ribonuclease P complex subunit Pop1 [Patellaria atrata CBS 101060]
MLPNPPSGSQKRKLPVSFQQKPDRKTLRRIDIQNARRIETQPSAGALKSGSLDLGAFIKAREFEIRALEEGMKVNKHLLRTRAFQDLPRELRRRTASHNKDRVPKRLRARVAKEMAEDNTPTVTARRRKPSGHMRLRLETAKRLEDLGKRKEKKKKDNKEGDDPMEGVTVTRKKDQLKQEDAEYIKARVPRAKKNKLQSPPVPPAKFRKRQLHKAWLPTHMFHAKRAHMTPPSASLWRFSIPLTPTQKSYRITHRASVTRGSVAWDMSYMATIGLEGPEISMINVFRWLGVGADVPDDLWGPRGHKWRRGVRSWSGWLYERGGWPANGIAPATVMWCVQDQAESDVEMKEPSSMKNSTEKKRKALIRVHPSAFLQVWEQLLHLCARPKPPVTVEDLRFEIGSIEITGPNSTEALLGILHPCAPLGEQSHISNSPEDIWSELLPGPTAATLPSNVLLGFSIADPRLRHPPRTIPISNVGSNSALLNILTTWPIDNTQRPQLLFDRKLRYLSTRSYSSQKSINRRYAACPPGQQYPTPLPHDPAIPILLLTTRPSGSAGGSGTWTLMLPWKFVLPIWQALMYYPNSCGGNPRFGGLEETRQLAFEAGVPWFPGDYPMTKAGREWRTREEENRKKEWEKRPKSKRVAYESVDLGEGRKGEIGMGWGCDWERLLRGLEHPVKNSTEEGEPAQRKQQPHHLPSALAQQYLDDPSSIADHSTLSDALVTVKLSLLTRGAPKSNARIYRLPTDDSSLRARWLALLPSNREKSSLRPPKNAMNRNHLNPNPKKQHLYHRAIASSILDGPPKPGAKEYPHVPGEVDLIGFVTTGNFNLGEGRGSGIGCIVLGRVAGVRQGEVGKGEKGIGKREESRICIVRDSGESVGRLAKWDIV